jgi:hypothetical protein
MLCGDHNSVVKSLRKAYLVVAFGLSAAQRRASAAARREPRCRLGRRWAWRWNGKSHRQGGRLHALLGGTAENVVVIGEIEFWFHL